MISLLGDPIELATTTKNGDRMQLTLGHHPASGTPAFPTDGPHLRLLTTPSSMQRASGKAPADEVRRPQRELLSGWGRTSPVRCEVLRPDNPLDVEDVLGERTQVIARGLGRSYGDAAQAAGGTVINTIGLDGIRAFDPTSGTITVDAGVSLDRLMQFVIPRGWFVGVTPGTRQVTIGGAIAADVHGKNHHHDGTFCEHVTDITISTGRGVEHLTPHGTPDKFWATAGGMGLTGVITAATLQLRPIETPLIASRTERHGDLSSLMDALRVADTASTYTVAWIDTLSPGRRLGRGLVMSGEHATRNEVESRRPGSLDDAGEFRSRSIRLPDVAVPLLSPTVGKAFNRVWYRINRTGEHLESIGMFFHPLDAIANWNLLYGRRGFVQWQCAVPDTAAWVIDDALRQLAAIGAGSFMSILKRFGPSNDGPLSFPIGGWTLAVDVPTHIHRLAATLDRLDQQTASAGGRIYFAKDARLDAQLVPAMYPRLDEWRETRDAMDPDRLFASDLSRRLHLTDTLSTGCIR